jgi:hypothetical protein
MRLARSKASPLATLVIDTWTGKDFLGDPVDNTDISQWAERIAPLAVQDIYEAFQEQGGWSAGASAAAIVGAGVIVYDLPRWPDLDEYYMIKDTPSQKSSVRRLKYRKNNALQEARLFVRGDVTTLSSPRARNLVLDIMSEHNVDPKDVRGYSKQFKDKPVPEGRSVSQEEKDRLKAKQDRVVGQSTPTWWKEPFTSPSTSPFTSPSTSPYTPTPTRPHPSLRPRPNIPPEPVPQPYIISP